MGTPDEEDDLSQLTVNPSKVVHETVDGETILIHLGTGSYYSLTGAAAEIWGLVAAAWPRDQIARELAERHGQPEPEVANEIEELLRQLEDEDLLEPGTGSPQANGAGPPAWRAESWAPPKLEKFDDMQDFLLVDPVHEVDQAGWPSRKPE